MNQQEYYALSKAEKNHWWFISMRKRLATLFEAACKLRGQKNLSVLDVGCGTGNNLNFLQSRFGYIDQWMACEPNKWACQYSRDNGINTCLSTLEDFERSEAGVKAPRFVVGNRRAASAWPWPTMSQQMAAPVMQADATMTRSAIRVG